MSKFHVKSILLGIGIGIVITGFVSVIYFSGYSSENQLSEAQVKKMARQYGMVEPDEMKLMNDNSKKVCITEDDTVDDITETLFKKNIISSKIEFKTLLKKLNKEQKIKPGNYSFDSSLTMEQIISMITLQ